MTWADTCATWSGERPRSPARDWVVKPDSCTATASTSHGGGAAGPPRPPQELGHGRREAVAAVPALGRGRGQVRGQVGGPHADQIPEDPAVAGVEPVGDREQAGQPAAQVAAGGRGRKLLGVAADARPDHRDEQGVAGGEVPEDRAPADPGRLGHVVDGRGQAAGRERDPGGAQDPLLGDLPLLAGERQLCR